MGTNVNSILREAETLQAASVKADPQSRPQRITVWSEYRIFIFDGEQVVDFPGDADFSSYEGCLMLGVKQSDHYQFPLYRARLGTIIRGGRFVDNITPKANIDQLRLGKVEWDDTIDGTLALFEYFKIWLHEQCLGSVDSYLLSKGLREEAAKPKTRKNSKKEV